jgi:hypothetical protein
MAGASTFSVGVFPRKPSGKRAGAAVLRIIGSRNDRGMDRVAAVAEMACACLGEPNAKPAEVVDFLRKRTSGATRVVLKERKCRRRGCTAVERRDELTKESVR